MSLIENERTKLSASALNGVAIASIVAGFITPVAAIAFGVSGAGGRGPALTIIAAAAFPGTGIGLHVLARRLLGGLVQ